MEHFSYGLFGLDSSVLVVIDVQEKLVPAMWESSRIIHKTNTLLAGAAALQIPILITEQYPKGLGSTDPRIHFHPALSLAPHPAESSTPQALVLEKVSFSIFGDEQITAHIQSLGVQNLLICGIESHICVLQSVLHACKLGFEVWVANDALSSRDPANHHNALQLMADSGAKITNVESILFGAMHTAKHPSFKTLSALIK